MIVATRRNRIKRRPLLTINANVKKLETTAAGATTTGVHTFTAVPVLPANCNRQLTIMWTEVLMHAHIADNAIRLQRRLWQQVVLTNEAYVDGSIDAVDFSI